MHKFGFLKVKNMEIRTFGGGRRMAECNRLLSDAPLGNRVGRLILLPIPTARDNKYITGTATGVGEIVKMLDADTCVAGYNIPREILNGAIGMGAFVYDAALDEDFLVSNAELTARGALGYILTHSKSDLSDMSVGVVGYGRIGIRLVRWLLPFGARITVYTNRPEVAVELGEIGISASLVGEKIDFSKLDLLINTAPARQLDDSLIPPELMIIDLASGSIFEPSAKVIKLASIPDALYPITAGRLYAQGIIRAIGGGG